MEPLPYRWPLKYPIPALNEEEKPENRFWMRSLTNRELFSPAFNQSPDGVYVTDIAVNRWDKAQQDTIWFKRDYFGCCAIGAATTREAERPYVYDDFVNFWFGFPDGSVHIERGGSAVSQEFKDLILDKECVKLCYDMDVFDCLVKSLDVEEPTLSEAVTLTKQLMWKPGCLKDRSDEDAVSMLLFGAGIWPYDTVAEYEKRFHLSFWDWDEVEYQLYGAYPKDVPRVNLPRVPQLNQRCSFFHEGRAAKEIMMWNANTAAWALAEIRLLQDIASETASYDQVAPPKHLAAHIEILGWMTTPAFPGRRRIMLNHSPSRWSTNHTWRYRSRLLPFEMNRQEL